MAAASNKTRRRQIGIETVVAAAIVAIIVGFVLGRATSPRSGSADPVEVAAADGSSSANTAGYVEKKLDLDPSPYKGGANAPVEIYEVSDFQ